jgi:hypothetical protein
MDAYLMYILVAAAGGFCGVVLPYLFKLFQDPTLKFDLPYFWSLFVSMLVAVTVLIPKGVPFDLTTAVTLFLACLGITVPTNRIVKSALKL